MQIINFCSVTVMGHFIYQHSNHLSTLFRLLLHYLSALSIPDSVCLQGKKNILPLQSHAFSLQQEIFASLPVTICLFSWLTVIFNPLPSIPFFHLLKTYLTSSFEFACKFPGASLSGNLYSFLHFCEEQRTTNSSDIPTSAFILTLCNSM